MKVIFWKWRRLLLTIVPLICLLLLVVQWHYRLDSEAQRHQVVLQRPTFTFPARYLFASIPFQPIVAHSPASPSITRLPKKRIADLHFGDNAPLDQVDKINEIDVVEEEDKGKDEFSPLEGVIDSPVKESAMEKFHLQPRFPPPKSNKNSVGPGEGGAGFFIDRDKLSKEEQTKYDQGWKDNAFNQYVSDMISVRRYVVDQREGELWLLQTRYFNLSTVKLALATRSAFTIRSVDKLLPRQQMSPHKTLYSDQLLFMASDQRYPEQVKSAMVTSPFSTPIAFPRITHRFSNCFVSSPSSRENFPG